MDKATQTYIENSLNIKVGDQVSIGCYSYTGCLSEVYLDDLVKNQYTAVEWQEPESHDCGNNDGVLYIYLPAIEDVGELFIGVNVAEYLIYVS